MLRDFIPKSDFFIKPKRHTISPISAAEDGSIYKPLSKNENKKKRKSRKLEFLTSLLDAMMVSILEFSAKMRTKYEAELAGAKNQLFKEQDKWKRKIDYLRQSIQEIEVAKLDFEDKT